MVLTPEGVGAELFDGHAALMADLLQQCEALNAADAEVPSSSFSSLCSCNFFHICDSSTVNRHMKRNF